MGEGPILVVCPAVLRFSWAEELERWFPCLPSDIHLGKLKCYVWNLSFAHFGLNFMACCSLLLSALLF